MITAIKNAYSEYQKFWIKLFIQKYIPEEQITKTLVEDLNQKIIFHNLYAFRITSVIVVLIELVLIFTFDLPMLKSASAENQFLYLGYLYSHISIIALSVFCNFILYLPISAYKKLCYHHGIIVPLYSFFLLVICGYMDALNYYSTKTMNLFIIVMLMQLVVFIFSMHFILFHLIINFGLLIFFIDYYKSFDAGALNSIINIGILSIFAFVSGYLRFRGFVRNEIIEKQRQALDVQMKLTNSFERFVPKEFLSFLNRTSVLDIELGDQTQREMTVLFSDIRSFTTLSESMSPQENFNFINAYLSRMGPHVRQNQGFIDKYIGDAVMALFPNKPDDAINAGIEMQKEIILYNKNRTEKGLTPISIGIGIHTGNLMLGIIGETERMEGTVISDTVNLASRLEGLTKLYGITIMISEDTLLKVENIEIYKYRLLDNVVVKGKQNSIRVYQIFEGMSEREEELLQATKLSFELGIEAYLGRRFTEALELFQNVANVYPEDVPTQIYLKRCNKSITEGVSDDWTGIERMTEK
ncbi:MAG TPA: adenylate/guanylate cyclase domain-containing protein [Leptospiraceae bacterium]|nr:adenylate/guanylate cyclase domain-containing protein [Leptospiraceae bacterium]HMW08099.1 adenylate/guanylate cyclase domain-containing protein [Leptospiraceae bacterium]HMY33810.1 adenylate/guanylate cyclase domain-containing protein [Leptospiraceae bacterium]HMZ65921.1 adenylate/guanylate cyclase domain-containing protein [Leptospiraceae bacterium]HNA08857.1 adenylate/guanylate cyclase domain-containing protein [Leptospiraceae bacterium]